jgi:hypothetical protein
MSKVAPAAMVTLFLAVDPSAAEPLPRGAFAVDASVEIPNVAGPSWRSTRFVCLDGENRAERLPIPVLFPNNPFGNCEARDLEWADQQLRYRIVCAGRGSARALASYVLSADGFRGEIAMVLGAKNMTLTEYQVGRRLGDCISNSTAADP